MAAVAGTGRAGATHPPVVLTAGQVVTLRDEHGALRRYVIVGVEHGRDGRINLHLKPAL